MSLNRHAVRVRLRNGATLTGRVHVAEGQPLSTFLSRKLFFLNLTDVEWADSPAEEALSHLSVRLQEIVWVEPLDSRLHVSSAAFPSEETRDVELQIGSRDGWDRLRVKLHVSRETRMSDYLEANPGFIPLLSVRVAGSGEAMERVALNHEAIAAVREVGDSEPGQPG